jgi:two-component system sensor histidine kinase UhpB
VAALNAALGRITRNVWWSIGLGLAVLGIFMGVLAMARAREMNKRRRQAEELLQSSFLAREQERRRIVGALHDDIGQPLYRVLYGLEGSRARLGGDDPVADELGHLEEIVREMDGTLRNELRILQVELAADTGLDVALEDLVALTVDETGLDMTLTVGLVTPPPREQSTELYRAAREAITNVRKHAQANHVAVSVYEEGGRIVLDVIDDGVGVVDEPGLGLSTTRQRFRVLGGDVVVSSISDRGTRFHAWLPVAGSGRT